MRAAVPVDIGIAVFKKKAPPASPPTSTFRRANSHADTLLFPSRRIFLGDSVRPCSPRVACLPNSSHHAVAREGPFYPDKLPLDTDNDLIIINDAITPAVGEITHLTGRVLDTSGSPVRNALVEIWQCDAKEVYHHTGDNAEGLDKNFQGYGKFTTGRRASIGSAPSSPFLTQGGLHRISTSRSRRPTVFEPPALCSAQNGHLGEIGIVAAKGRSPR